MNDLQLTQEYTDLTSSHDKCSVLTNSSAGVTVILNDLQLTQEYIDVDLQPWLVLSAYQQQCKHESLPEWPPVDPGVYWTDLQPVLTNSSEGMTVFLNDLQLTQEHAEMTSSHDYSAQCLPTAVQAWRSSWMTSSWPRSILTWPPAMTIVLSAYQQQCKRDGLPEWPPVDPGACWDDLQPWQVLGTYQQQCRRGGLPEWPPVDPGACRDDLQPWPDTGSCSRCWTAPTSALEK